MSWRFETAFNHLKDPPLLPTAWLPRIELIAPVGGKMNHMSQRTRVLEANKIVSRNKAGKPNGCIISLYKDWERQFKVEPKQVYLNICNPGESKGPHLHLNRWSYFSLIRGSMRFVLKYGDNDFEEVDLHVVDGTGVRIVEVPPALACLMINIGSEDAWVINMLNPAWHPDRIDDAPVDYADYISALPPAERIA